MSKSALLVTAFPWAGMSTPVKNTASYLIDHDWDVTLATIGDDPVRFPFPEEIESKIKIVRLPAPGKNPLAIWSVAYKLFAMRRERTITFLFDHQALFCASLVVFIDKKKSCIYYSLEFYEPKRKLGALFKALERKLSKRCTGVITQHQTRADYLLNDGVGRRVWIVPNSPRAECLGVGDDQNLRTHLRPESKIKLLCIGTLGTDTRVDELLEWFSSEAIDCELTLHGWFVSREVELLADRVLGVKQKDLFVSTRFVEEQMKWEVFRQTDAVFVGFRSTCKNLELAAGSAGKFYDAIRMRKPILAIDAPGMRELVEGLDVGVVVSNVAELNTGIAKLKASYGTFTGNCEMAHKHFAHDLFFKSMLRRALANIEV